MYHAPLLSYSVQGKLFKSDSWVHYKKSIFIHNGQLVRLHLYNKHDSLITLFRYNQPNIDKIQNC